VCQERLKRIIADSSISIQGVVKLQPNQFPFKPCGLTARTNAISARIGFRGGGGEADMKIVHL
jgi:hypothetical protein